MANWWDSPASPTTAPVAPNPVTPAPDNNLLTYYQRQMAVRPKWTPPDAPYSLSAPSLALSAPPDTQAPAALEAKAPEAPGVLGSTWNALKGAGVEALKTTQSIGPALYGLADTATGGYLDIGRRRLQAGIQNALGDDTRWQDIDPIAVSQQRTGAMQDELKPDQYRQWEQDVAQQQGAWDKTKATLSHPGLMVGKVAGLAPYLLGGELGLGAKATTAGFGALMGGQSSLDAQARVYDKPIEELQKLPDYRPDQSEADNRARLAQQAARPAAALGAAAGVIPGAIAGKALHGPVTALLGGAEKVAASLPRTMAQGVLQQAPEFAAMNAGTTLAGNVGLRAVDPNQPLMENVPETVAEGLLVGGLSGMAVHPVMSRYQGNKGAKAYTAVLDQVHENRAAVPDTDLAKYVANGQELLTKTPMGQTPRADLLDAVTRTQQIIVDRQAAVLAQREAAIADYVKQQAPPIPPEATLDPTADPYGAMIQEAAQRDDLWNEQRESLKRNVAHLEQLKQLRVEQDQRAQESARLEAARKVGEAQRQATTPTIPEGYDPTLDTVGRLPTSTLPPGYDPNPSASMGALGQLGPTRLGASQEPSPLVGLLGVKPPDAVRPPVAALEQNPLDLLRQTARPDVVASAPLASEGQLPNGPNEMNRLLGNAPAPAKPPVSEVAPQTPDELLNRPARIQPREGTPDAAQSENAARPVGENQSVSATADHGNADAADEGRADEVRPAESAAGQEQERPAGQEQGQGQEVAPTPPIAADSSTPPEISHDQRSQGRQAQAETETLLNQQPVDPTVPPKESLVGLSYEQLAKLKSEFDAFLDQYGDQHSWVRSADGKMRETIISNRNIWADYGHALTKALNSAPRPPQAEPPPRQPAPPDPRIAAIDERVNRQIAERQQQVDTIKAATLEKMQALKLEAQRRQQAGEDPQTIVADLGPALTTGKQVLDWLEQRAFEARDQRGYSVNLRAQGATLSEIPDWITRHVESVESKESAPPQEGAGKSPATTKPRQSYADKVALHETDDLLTAIAKMGGIDRASAKREGIDPSEFKRMPVFGKPLFRKTGGRSMDTMAEVLSEAGYPVLDENGYYTVNRLLDQLDAALRGEQIYTPKGYEDMARREAEDRQRQQEADDWALDDVELEASGFNGLADSEQAIADWKVNARKQLGVDKADALFERIAEKSNADSESEFLQELNDAYSREMENGGGGRGSSVRNAPEESGRAATAASPEDFSLSGYSQADLNARAAEVARAQAEQSAKDKAADQKAAADRARGDFVLSGSDRPADVAVAHGQQELAPAAEIPKPTAQNPNAAFNARQGEGGDAPLASRNEPTPDRTPPTREELTQHLKDAVGEKDAQALLDSGRVRIHDDASTVPEASRPAGRFAASVDKDGVAHFVLSEMDAATAKGVLAHESGHIGEKLGHFDAADRPVVKVAHAVLRVAGLEGLIGKPTFDNLVEQTRALADKGVASAKDAQDWVNHLVEKGLLDSADAGRELVSYTLEYAPNNLPLVKRIVATIRAALYRMGVKMQLNEADLLALARSALKSAAREGRNELTRAGHLLNQMKESPALSGMTGDIYASRPNPLRLAQAAADKVAARLPESAKEFGRRILEEAQLWAAPMAVGTARTQAPAKDYANGVRQTWYEATKTLERLTKDFTPKQHKAMWNGMDATSVWVQQQMNGGMDRDAAMRAAQAQRVGVFALPAAQRDAALALSTRADALWKRAKDAGMVQDDAQGLPFWTPRVAAIIGEDGSFGKPPSKNEGVQNPDHPGIGFTTTSPNLKHRGHVFAADSEAGMQKLFGDKAALVRDIRVMPLAMARLEQAIAGRELINQVKAIGKAIGAEVTSTSPKRGYFTLDHPAFQTFVPRIEKQANGAWEQVQETVTDVDGHTTLRPAFEKQPLYIAKEFEGPLRAVLNTRSGAIYQGLMGLKRGAMSLVMFSPMIHNAVIWGKAFPAMPGKMITGKIYFEGNRAKRDPSLMKEAIGNGLAPINSGAFHPDVPTGLNSLSGHDAGLISTALSKGVGLVNKSAGAALAKGLDQLGGFWHNTMLWDRVADLQMGLYVNLKQHQMDKGLDAQSAGRVAAHFANRYAGAIPQEAMGEGARRLGNLALFSRSFTLGNLAIMKDMLTGLPQDVKAQILRDAGQGAMDKATAAARKKAWVMLAADIGLMYVGNALLQGVVDKLKLDKSLDEIGQGYARRLDKALKAADGNPLQLVNPWSAAFLPDRLSPGSEHEPGKEDRIFTGRDPRTGTASYTRLPTGKVGEELLRWPTRPLEMLRKKQSTLLRPTMEIFANRDHFNNPVYDADAPGLDGMVQRVGQVVGHFLSGQAPVEEAGAAYRSLTGQAVTGDTLKWAGPLMGFTAGRGYPGGPELGAIATAERRHADEIKAMRPEIKRLVDGGQVQEAVRQMTRLGMSPTAQRALIVSVVAPQSRLNSGALMRFYRNATVEEKAKLQDVIDAR